MPDASTVHSKEERLTSGIHQVIRGTIDSVRHLPDRSPARQHAFGLAETLSDLLRRVESGDADA